MTISVLQKGDLRRISASFKDLAGAAVDPTTVTFKFTKPSGVTTSYVYPAAQVVKDSVGNYHVDLSVDASGLWLYRWESTGTGQAAENGEFMVEPSAFA